MKTLVTEFLGIVIHLVYKRMFFLFRTPADESNDRTTLDRALDERLVLIIKPRSGDDWRLPESAWEVRGSLLLLQIVYRYHCFEF